MDRYGERRSSRAKSTPFVHEELPPAASSICCRPVTVNGMIGNAGKPNSAPYCPASTASGSAGSGGAGAVGAQEVVFRNAIASARRARPSAVVCACTPIACSWPAAAAASAWSA